MKSTPSSKKAKRLLSLLTRRRGSSSSIVILGASVAWSLAISFGLQRRNRIKLSNPACDRFRVVFLSQRAFCDKSDAHFGSVRPRQRLAQNDLAIFHESSNGAPPRTSL